MRMIRYLLAFTVLILVNAATGHAATVPLTVNANTEADWASDKFYRAPGTCVTPGAFATVGTVPKNAVMLFSDTVASDGVYCYKATAVDTAGNESLFSNTLEVTVNTNPPSAPANLRLAGPVVP